jgi:4-hydroxy-tetrahydrodipicolinate synthase
VFLEGGVIASDHVRHPMPPLAPETRSQLLELAAEVEPLALRWGK